MKPPRSTLDHGKIARKPLVPAVVEDQTTAVGKAAIILSLEAARTRLGLHGPANAAERHALIKRGGSQKPATALSQRDVEVLGRRFAPAWLRLEVLERDGYKCRYCRRTVTDENANIDHLKPWPFGMTERANLVTSCRPCNQAKGRSDGQKWRRKAAATR